ncbi:sensor histidine kinase [Citrifermentans bremense]|uniref:sensor histidine kinase n=1 Tax=Citrifermentans bremense TaxID=60035 RepID=UPI000420FD6E|nr:DUF3365 domain-containing protein [Citrifermentans bremense]
MENREIGAEITPPRSLKYYEWGLAAGWTLVIAVLLMINLRHERSQAIETARTQARSDYQRDVIYRHWNATFGAVYAPVSPRVHPNQYLARFPERDIVTTDGRRLTWVNPAYMTRLALELASETYGVKGHITSLRPIRPENFPDPWERDALASFTNGSREADSVEEMGGASYLRLMKPLVTEKECLKCHGDQGYRIGDIRGGLSVAVPMEPLWAIARQNSLLSAMSFSILWLLGLAGICVGAGSLRRTIAERNEAERRTRALNADLLARTTELEAANRELDAFCSAVSHDLRSPLTVIDGFCNLIREAPELSAEDSRSYAGIMLSSTQKMERLITTLLNFSRIVRNEIKSTMVDMTALSREIETELRLAEVQRKAVFCIAEGLEAQGDPDLLRVVMQNLLGNAWKYTRTRPVAEIEVGMREIGGESQIFVRDNGIGFDNAVAGGIFEAFQRLPNAAEFAGTGIGLATVKRIIARHGGRIGCEGETGKGATFFFTLKTDSS